MAWLISISALVRRYPGTALALAVLPAARARHHRRYGSKILHSCKEGGPLFTPRGPG